MNYSPFEIIGIAAVLLALVGLCYHFFVDVPKIKQRITRLEQSAQKTWTHGQLEDIENALISLGRYKYELDQTEAFLENGIGHLVNMKKNGNGKK